MPNTPVSCPADVGTHLPDFFGLARLMRMSFENIELGPLCQSLLKRAEDNVADACALLDASIILQFYRHTDLALQVQREALQIQRNYRLPSTRPVRVKLLALVAPGNLMANVPLECLLEDSDIELTLCYATSDPNLSEIPDHDVLFFAMSESEDNRPLIEAWAPLLAHWPRPVINDPSRVYRVARDTLARLLQGQPGLAMPPTYRLGRLAIEAVAQGRRTLADAGFPFILRPVDSHAGNDLYKVDDGADLLDKLGQIAGDDFFLSPFVDYRSSDGLFRKYRVVLIEGRPYACHMGISDHWMIHYLNAGMADDAGKRAEEAAFMSTFDEGFAQRHAAAFAAIHQAVGLAYLGIDCAETADGRLLIFEAEHAMVVHAMDPVDRFAYKQAPMQHLFAAFRNLVLRAAEQDAPLTI
jgi:glutathione synthase/RimK-type ligase-like ATP-grasp enzyme